VANRITLGLVLAALIVGAALLMGVETDFRLLGYPGLAILLFLGAAACGLVLVFSILLNDIRPKNRVKGSKG
jgi:Na+/proline symporter